MVDFQLFAISEGLLVFHGCNQKQRSGRRFSGTYERKANVDYPTEKNLLLPRNLRLFIDLIVAEDDDADQSRH